MTRHHTDTPARAFYIALLTGTVAYAAHAPGLGALFAIFIAVCFVVQSFRGGVV